MPSIPRGLSGSELSRLLGRFGYVVTRQTGSHLRLTSTYRGSEHHLTIPNHTPVKIGTLNNIISDVAQYLKLDKKILLKELF